MQNEANREWLLPARLKVQRLASEAESARVFGLEVQAETHSHVAKIRGTQRTRRKAHGRTSIFRAHGRRTDQD